MKLDVLDKKIINALNENPRASFSRIAKKLRSSKEVVNYRFQRLKENKIINSIVTIFGFGHWSYKVLVQLEKATDKEEIEILNYLKNFSGTTWITPCSGNWDLVFVVMSKDPAHFDRQFREILLKIKKYIHDYKVSVSIGSSTFGHTYVFGSIKESMPAKRIKNLVDFDDIDKKISKLIRKDARIRLVDIANKIKVSSDTVKYRIRKMEENSIIKRYRLVLDTTNLGYNRYEIFIRCINQTDAVISKFREFGKVNPNVEYMSKLVGSWDIEYTVHFRNTRDFRKFVLEIKEKFGEFIKSFESVTLFETLEYTYVPEELN